MSQKKNRRPNSSAAVKRQADQRELADRKDRERRRMDPTARLLLLGDLVFLAVCQLLDQQGLLSQRLSLGTVVLGIVFLLLALYFQFGRRGRRL